MPIEREIYRDVPPTRDRDVIVTNTDREVDAGTSVATTMLAVIGIVIVLVVGYFVIQALGNDTGDGTVFPEDVNVNIQDDPAAPAPAPAPADQAPADQAPADQPAVPDSGGQ